MSRFALAPMSRLLWWLTAGLLLLPVVLTVAGLLLTAAVVVAVYAVVWLLYRPTAFEARPDGLLIHFPLRRLGIARHDLARVRAVDVHALRERYGLALRVGVGGLWGVFGWLWTRRRGFIDVYASRADGLVLVERRSGRDLLITPDRPDEFVQTLQPEA